MPAAASPPRWLSKEQQHAWRALVLGTQLLFDRLDDDLREQAELSLTEYEIMVRLSEAGNHMRMAALADSLAHSRSRVTHTIKRMESAGLVAREVSADDGRGVIAKLTRHGLTVLERAAPIHVESVRDHMVDRIAASDLAAVGRVMNAVADRLVAEKPEREMR